MTANPLPQSDSTSAAAAAPAANPIRQPVITFENVSFTYPGAAAPALENVTLRITQGERLGILGPNGGGKSTMLKLMLGVLSGNAGRILVRGDAPARARAAGFIGYVAQRPDIELAMPISVREMVTLGAAWRAAPWSRPGRAVRERVDRVLNLVGASEFVDSPVGKLSGGQFQRALVARALAAQPQVLVLDEPAVGIDAAGQERLAELLDNVHREMGLTIIIVSHDLRAIAAGSDRVACLARRLHYHASPDGLTPAVLGELFSHDVLGALGQFGSVHVHAHAADQCPSPPSCGHDHGHVHPKGAHEHP